MEKDQFFDYPLNEESKQKVINIVQKASPEFISEMTKRWERGQSCDYYEGMWAAIRVMQSFPAISPMHQEYLSRFSAGCMIVLAEKIGLKI